MTVRSVSNRSRGVSLHADQERTSLSGGGSNYILKPNAPAQIWRPKYGAVDNCVRIMPALDLTRPGEFMATRVPDPDNAEEMVFSDWILKYPVGSAFCTPGATMLLGDPNTDPRELAAASPFYVLRNSIEHAIKKRQERPGWGSLVDRTSRQKVLPPPTSNYLVQCWLYRQDNKPQFVLSNDRSRQQAPRGARPDDNIVVYQLPVSAGNALVQKMREGKQPYETDPIDMNAGAFVHFWQKGSNLLGAGHGGSLPNQDADMFGGGGGGEGGGRGGWDPDRNAYEAVLTPTIDGRPNDPPASMQRHKPLVAAKVKPWDQLLFVPTYEQQLHILCTTFLACTDAQLRDILVDVLRYAYSADQLTESVRNYGRKVATVPGGVPARAPAEPAADAGDAFFAGTGSPDGYADPVTSEYPDIQMPEAPPPAASYPTWSAPPVAAPVSAPTPIAPAAPLAPSATMASPSALMDAQRAAADAKARALARTRPATVGSNTVG